MQKQLSIFDSLKPLDTAPINIKPGDWVRLLRKTPHAAYWKKGEIVQIEGVHPANHSARFWNERANDWAYLHPCDMVKVAAPLEREEVQPIAPIEELPPVPHDSVSNTRHSESQEVQPIAVDTELNCQHSHTEEVQPIARDTELNLATCEINSVSPHLIAVDTELTPAPDESNSVSGPVSRYKAKGTARGGEYYRFSYRDGKKMKHVHIPGGNTGSVLAQERAAEVMELSAAGVLPAEICDRIKGWSKKITW